MEYEIAAPLDRSFGDIPPGLERDAGALREGPLQPLDRAGAAVPRGRGNRPGHRPFRQRLAQSQSRRT